MTLNSLVSAEYEFDDLDEAVEFYYRKGWTDGLPVVIPTQEKVLRFLAAAGREPGEVLGVYPTRRRTVTVEKVAINAIMAGCLPEYFPVVLAIIEGILEPDFGIHGPSSTTGGAAIGFIVNGPIRNKIGMNYRGNVLGPGNRANSTIGRAIRLTQINVMGSVPGAGNEGSPGGRTVFDRATMGNPGKYACYHIVENEEDFPSLLPLHVERGFPKDQSVVSVFGTAGHVQISVHAERSAEEIMDTIAHYLVGSGRLTATPKDFCVVVIPPETARYIERDGWSKADIRQALFERTSHSTTWLKEHGWQSTGMLGPRGGPVLPGDNNKMMAIAGSPEEIYVVVAGGPAGAFAHYFLPYAGPVQTREVRT